MVLYNGADFDIPTTFYFGGTGADYKYINRIKDRGLIYDIGKNRCNFTPIFSMK